MNFKFTQTFFSIILLLLAAQLNAQLPLFRQNTNTDTNKQHLNLYWSEQEVKAASKILSGKTFLYQDASETRFKRYAPETAVIHLATHAELNDENPMYSNFIFSKTPGSLDDGLLHTYELYNMKLNAELSVLSGCNTGGGKLVRGEGIISLARGFRYAGCPNIVMSLWQIDDKSTSNIMKKFYQYLDAGISKADALHRAKIDFLNNADAVKANPYYWASFIFIGQDAPLLPRNNHSYGWLLFFIFTFVSGILAILLFQRRKTTIIGMGILLTLSVSSVVVFFTCTQNISESNVVTNNKNKPDNQNIYERAELYFYDAYYDSAIQFYHQAAKSFLKNGDSLKYIACLSRIGKSFIYQTEYDSADYYLKKSLTLCSKIDSSIAIEKALIYNNMGTLLRKQGSSNLALKNYHQALSVVTKSNKGKSEVAADILLNLGVYHYLFSRLDSASFYNKKSISTLEQISQPNNPLIAHNYNLSGLIFEKRINFEEALHWFNLSLALRKRILRIGHPDFAQNYLNIGVLHFRKGDYQKASTFYQNALENKVNAYGEKNISVAGVYLNLGVVSDKNGDHEKALSYYHKAESIMLGIGNENHAMLGDIYNNLGIGYKNIEQNQQSLIFYKKALINYLEAFGENSQTVANLYLNLGNLYSILNNHPLAIGYFQKAVKLGKKLFKDTHPHLAICYLNMGIYFLGEEQLQQAEEYLKKSITMSKQLFGDRHPVLAEGYQNLGLVYLKKNQILLSLNAFQNGLIAASSEFSEKDITTNPPINDIRNESLALDCLFYKAEALEKLYLSNPHSTENLIFAMDTYNLGTGLIQLIYHRYSTEDAMLKLGTKTREFYSKAIDTAYKLFVITGMEKFKEKAFVLTEKSKSTVLRQIMVDSKAKKFAGIPDSLLEAERQLKIDMAFFRKMVFESKTRSDEPPAHLKNWQNKLFSSNQKHETLIHRFETDFPEYFDLKYQTDIKLPADLLQALPEDSTAILEYFLTDTTMFIFTLSKRGFDFKRIKIDSSFYSNFEDMNEGIANRDFFLYANNAHLLYQKLIQPVKSKIPGTKLIIIPDGILGYLPFEALLSEKPDSSLSSYAHLNYLIKEYQISYNYGACFLPGDHIHNGQPKYNFIGFAPIEF